MIYKCICIIYVITFVSVSKFFFIDALTSYTLLIDAKKLNFFLKNESVDSIHFPNIIYNYDYTISAICEEKLFRNN